MRPRGVESREIPTDVYSLDEAVADDFLVPPRGVSVPVRFVREGIEYDELSDDEKDEWDDMEWGEGEDGAPLALPDEVNAAQINKWLFNQDTVDKVLEHLMTHGIKVAGGDRLGKTIIFAKNQNHADFVCERFIANYPALDNGNFARIVECLLFLGGVDYHRAPVRGQIRGSRGDPGCADPRSTHGSRRRPVHDLEC
jgi:type I restriction enzyme R subunit